MLIVNLSDELVNGLTGKVTKMHRDYVEVHFPSVDKFVEIKQFSFTKYSPRLKKDVGSRIQIPLKLCFAMTIHKCQGSTIKRVNLDCRNLSQYGQLVVGLSRTTLKKGLRVVNFTKNLLRMPPPSINDFFSRPLLPQLEDLSCCIKSHEFRSSSPDNTTYSDETNILKFQNSDEISSEDELDLIEAIDKLDQIKDFEIEFQVPPQVDINSLLTQLMYTYPETEQQKLENLAIEYLMETSDCTRQFVQYVWNKLCQLKQKLLQGENISNKSFTEFDKECNKLLTSEDYKMRIRYLFSNNPSPEQYNIIFKLTTAVRKYILSLEAEPIRKEAEEQAKKETGKVFQESVGGVGKIRYIAGWCIHKLKKNRKKKIINIMYNRKKVKEMENLLTEKELLEHLEASESELEYSVERESLKEIERKQNIRKGLTNVTDKCSAFFQKLDSKIRSLQTHKNLDIHGTKFSSFLRSNLNEDGKLRNEWRSLFPAYEKNEEIYKLQDNILEQVYDKYSRMSIVQLRKEYLQQKKIKKT